MRRAILRTMAALSLALTQFATGAERFTLDGTLFDTVATDLALDPYLLYAIAIAESAEARVDASEASAARMDEPPAVKTSAFRLVQKFA